MTPLIDYESDGFPTGSPVRNGSARLTTTWSDLLWAAVTVGRPNRQFVFRHGLASQYEALFRWSLVRMSLEQAGQGARRLRRTQAAKTLDPSEKGAINYFLGLALAKLFADQLLQAPWLLHLDVFRPALNPVLKGRSRPDLVGQTITGQWVALECKGRASKPDASAKAKAKQQAQRLISVCGAVPSFAIGAITYFEGDSLRFFWRDPEPDPSVRNPVRVDIPPESWQYHYAPTLELIRSNPDTFAEMQRREVLLYVEEADLAIGIHPFVLRAILEAGRHDVRELVGGFEAPGLYRRDGIALVPGDSWHVPFEEVRREIG